MTESLQNVTGFALICDPEGGIRRVLRRDAEVLNALGPGGTLFEIVDTSNHVKVENFLEAVIDEGLALDWHLNVPVGETLTPLVFAGAAYSVDEVMVVIAQSSGHTLALFEEMMRMNNEQTNHLRQLLKDQSAGVRTQSEQDSVLYDELSRLNNELANLQRELVRKNAELERLNDLKDQFLGMAAHDLRSPLTVIMTYSRFVRQEAEAQLSEEHCEFMDVISEYSQFMLGIINDLLDVSIIERGQLTLTRVQTDLVELATVAAKHHSAIAKTKSVTIDFQTDLTELIVQVDPDRITQVINNLLSNAVKFSPTGKSVQVSLTASDGTARIDVRDHGVGIEPERLANLFDHFGQRSNEGTEGEKGTGLGLAIASKIVAEHDGEIAVESELGSGTVFTVRLPIG